MQLDCKQTPAYGLCRTAALSQSVCRRVPHITISPGLRNFWEDKICLPALDQSEVADGFVVRRKEGSAHSKLVVKWDLEGVAEAC